MFRQHPQYPIEIRANSSNPAIKDRVNSFNAMLCNTAGTRQLLVHPKCRELIKDLRQVKWKRDAAGNAAVDLDKSDPERTHVSDALGNCVAREFGLRPRVGPRPWFVN